MKLYTDDCTVVRTNAVLSESFEVNVGLHQGSEVVCLPSCCMLMT